ELLDGFLLPAADHGRLPDDWARHDRRRGRRVRGRDPRLGPGVGGAERRGAGGGPRCADGVSPCDAGRRMDLTSWQAGFAAFAFTTSGLTFCTSECPKGDFGGQCLARARHTDEATGGRVKRRDHTPFGWT